jgi:hypothetical protein
MAPRPIATKQVPAAVEYCDIELVAPNYALLKYRHAENRPDFISHQGGENTPWSA